MYGTLPKYWKKIIPKEKYPRGGKITNDTLEFVIDKIVDDVWAKAKEFYTKEKQDDNK